MHVPDPFAPSRLIDGLAAALAPRYRILSLAPRGGVAYQVSAADLLEVLRQFGFAVPVLIGERLGCLPALIIAAWYPENLGGLILADLTYDQLPGDTVEARALRDCPPDWATLRDAVHCPVLMTVSPSASLAGDVEAFLAATLP